MSQIDTVPACPAVANRFVDDRDRQLTAALGAADWRAIAPDAGDVPVQSHTVTSPAEEVAVMRVPSPDQERAVM
jgi:hypothetical protein